jgi:hypothetical protein
MFPAKRAVLALALAGTSAAGLAATPAATTAPRLADPVASYQIVCRLDPEKRTVEGSLQLTWKNTTARPAPTLRFHLYLNAFRNTLSTFRQESESARRHTTIPDSWGAIDLSRLTLSDGTDLLARLAYISPDDGNPHDRTVAEVSLPRAVAPGETIALSADFVSRLPRVSVRTGWKDAFFLVAQWFPKIGVLTDAGWKCAQFHANSEFFADFGDYDVSLEVPAAYRGKVAATGVLAEERPGADGRLLLRFRQSSVHDFAWAADPDFLVFEETFREPGSSDVALRLFLQPEHRAQKERHFHAARVALTGLSRLLGPYPHPTLSIVDPPWGARGANGMEYPTLITAGTRRFAPTAGHSPEQVTVHEIVHQYFQGMVGSNEVEEPWLDEGITVYVTERILAEAYGNPRPILDVFGWRGTLGIEMHRPLDTSRSAFGPLARGAVASPSMAFSSREAYGAVVYRKAALALATLERLAGREVMDRALRLYFERWRFRHPSSADFVAAFEEAAGADWSFFFDRTIFQDGALDYAVTEAATAPAESPRGVLGDRGEPVAPTARRGFDSDVRVERRGTIALPVEVVLHFEGGRVFRDRWDGQGLWKRYRFGGWPRLIDAVVDPEGKLLLDLDRTNNGLRTRPDARAAARWTARSLFWTQNLLDFLTVAW